MLEKLNLYPHKPILGTAVSKLFFLQNSLRLFILKGMGVEIKYDCEIAANVTVNLGFSNGKRGQIQIDSRAQISQGVILNCWGGNITLRENVFLGPYTVIYGHGGVIVGNDTLISMHCRILSSDHTIPDIDTRIRSQPDILLPTKIGEDVWLGAGVTVLGGVTIGDGCVVGAGAVVTKNLPPYSVAVGVPTKVVRTRI